MRSGAHLQARTSRESRRRDAEQPAALPSAEMLRVDRPENLAERKHREERE